LAVARNVGEVARVTLQRVVRLLGGCAVGCAALTKRGDRALEILWRDAGILQGLAGLRRCVEGEREQQALGGDELVARLLRGLLGGIEAPRERGREVNLSGTGAFDLRQLAERRLGVRKRASRIAAGRANEIGRQALLVIEENLQQMFR